MRTIEHRTAHSGVVLLHVQSLLLFGLIITGRDGASRGNTFFFICHIQYSRHAQDHLFTGCHGLNVNLNLSDIVSRTPYFGSLAAVISEQRLRCQNERNSKREKEMRQGGIEPPAQLILLAKLYFTTKPLALAGSNRVITVG